MKIALLCGGPSAERGISLNSARSVLDHLGAPEREIVPIYFDLKKIPYLISQAQLYSNTPSDFDFKLRESAKKLSPSGLLRILKSVDIVFPVIHGQFGEDGEIQALLAKNKIPFIGSPEAACKLAFDKYDANAFIKSQGFYTLPSAVLKIYKRDHWKILTDFFKKHTIKRAIVKPASGGSSLGVFSVGTVAEALEKVAQLFSKRVDTRVVVEPFCTGTEFTVIILENRFHMPVAILPTEIEADYEQHQIFDYRKKYLPTRQVKYHCPPRFSAETIERIQVQAEQLFTLLGMRDFSRFDGWVLPDGNIWFSDFNPVSGMEQNSFLFQQCARIGLSHRDTLAFIVRNSCERQKVPFATGKQKVETKKQVPVLFGGNTSERQVSLMSGTNVWLKLRRSKKYLPKPYLLGLKDDIWELPYALTLNHTVEEIEENCRKAAADMERLKFLQEKVALRLALQPGEASEEFFLPRRMKLADFLHDKKFIFLALHGGIGENGTLQKMLEQRKIKFNGPDEKASRLAMDKYKTGVVLSSLEQLGISIAPKKVALLKDFQKFSQADFATYWQNLVRELQSKSIVVKPQDEGCSAGIVRLFQATDLAKYIALSRENVPFVPTGTFSGQTNIIEMPLQPSTKLLFEKFIPTDKIAIRANTLKWKNEYGRIEVTVGVLGSKGNMRALNPSLTVAEGSVLSVEEKFQGGTGINLTPPPTEIIAPKVLDQVKKRIEIVAEKLGLSGYARIDAFVEVATGNLIIIEANTLPALTPSTVLFHQGLAEKKPIFPQELIEKIIAMSGY